MAERSGKLPGSRSGRSRLCKLARSSASGCRSARVLGQSVLRVVGDLSSASRPVCDHHRVADLAGSREPQLSLQPATRGDKEHKVTFDATHIYLDESSQSVDSIAKHNRTGAMLIHLVRCPCCGLLSRLAGPAQVLNDERSEYLFPPFVH